MKRSQLLTSAAAALAATAVFATSPAQAEFPAKPVTMIIGFAAGGGTDAQGRALAQGLQKVFGKPVTVVNKPGAASMVAAAQVAKSKPDGHTVWFGSAGTMVLASALGKTKLDFFKDFKLAGITGELVPSVTVHHDSPFKSVQDVIKAAKAKPGTLRWTHGGRASAFFAAGTGFAAANKLDVKDVPSTGRNMRGLIVAKQVDYGVTDAGDSITPKWKGKLRVLGAIRDSRVGVLDDKLPTLGEMKIPFFAVRSPVGLLVPKAVPDDVVKKIADAIKQVSQSQSFQNELKKRRKAAVYFGPSDGTAMVTELKANVEKLLPRLKSGS
ncbi:MAG: tripartite tricarboxylate transporter substrate binding protein [Rhodospirillales bacterium]|nr:tripartite tricarboxylate transporter substrate binding protein [Rhodospirillales bacterium]